MNRSENEVDDNTNTDNGQGGVKNSSTTTSPTRYGSTEIVGGPQAVVDTTPSSGAPLVDPSETVSPRVNWEERTFHDKVWAFVYAVALIAFLGCGFSLVANAHPRYDFHEATVVTNVVNGIQIYETMDVRTISKHYRSDVRKCCAAKVATQTNNNNPNYPTSNQYVGGFGWDLCDELTIDDAVRRRRLQRDEKQQRRRLQQQQQLDDFSPPPDNTNNDFGGGNGGFSSSQLPPPDSNNGFSSSSTTNDELNSSPTTTTGPNNDYNPFVALQTSKLEPGDGMFDVFLEAPEIPVTLTLFGLVLALIWIVLLRFFATPIVFATEAIKVAFFLYLTIQNIQQGLIGAAIVCILCILALIGWDVYTYKQLLFAGKMLSYAAKSFKENMELFCAFLPILVLYAFNAYLFVTFFAKSFEIVEVKQVEACFHNEFSGIFGGQQQQYDQSSSQQPVCLTMCHYESPSYTTGMVVYLSLAYLWSVLLFGTMRVSIIAHVIGSWHFHPENPPGIVISVWNTCTTSMGTLSISSLIATIAEKLNRLFLEEAMWKQCCNPIFCCLLPLYCLFGHCIRMFILMLTKFCVILHVFTGKSWLGSAKKVFKILKRHFKGGFVTEYASSNVLNLGSYVFSIGIYFVAWIWLDKEFKTDTFIGVNDSTILVVAWCFFALFNIWYPVLGIYLLILLNRFLSKLEFVDPANWVTPFAATFVACIAMMFFTYLAGIFLDTVDVCFLCFAIDRDNRVDLSNDEFAKLVHEGVDTVITDPDWSSDHDDEDDEETPPVMVTGSESAPNNSNSNSNSNNPREQEMTA